MYWASEDAHRGEEMSDNEFVPVQLVTVPPGKTLPFGVYLFIDNKHVCYVEEGQEFPKAKHDKLKERSVSNIFIQLKDEDAYNNFVEELYAEMFGKASPNEEKGSQIISEAKDAVADLAEGKDIEQNIKKSFKTVDEFYHLYQDDPGLLKKLYGSPVGSIPKVIKHCADVSMMATKLAMELKLPKNRVINLGVAGLLHDIGFKKLREDDTYTFLKDRKKFTPAQFKDYMQHVDAGVEVLRGKPMMNTEIERLIKYHEENLNGNGPYKLTKFSEDVEILSMVNVFDKYRVYNPNNIKEVFVDFKVGELGNYHLKLINELGKFLLKEGMIELAEVDTLKLDDNKAA